MTLPKTLQIDPDDVMGDIRDEHGSLVCLIYTPTESDHWTTREVRDEIIHRWNSYRTLRNTMRQLLEYWENAQAIKSE